MTGYEGDMMHPSALSRQGGSDHSLDWALGTSDMCTWKGQALKEQIHSVLPP